MMLGKGSNGVVASILLTIASLNSLLLVDGFVSPTSTTTKALSPSNQVEQQQFTSSSSSSLTTCWGKKPSNKKKKPKKSSSSPAARSGGFGAKVSEPDGPVGLPPKWIDRFPFAGSIRPGYITPQKIVNPQIKQPDYAKTSVPRAKQNMLPWVIDVKNKDQIEKMRAAGRLARHVLDSAGKAVKVGMTTNDIDELVHDLTIEAGAYPSPLNYHKFPKSCCTSVNEVICHGIPDDRQLQKGDIINIDITVYLNGYHGDCSEMFVVGFTEYDNAEEELDESTKKLLQATYDCWVQSLNIVKPGNYYKDIGGIIEDHVTPLGFSTVKNFCGHGVGSVFHTNPNILHYKNNEPNGEMSVGHTFTIEPMICEGTNKPLIWPDEWTATTADGKRSAQFEHTLLVTEDGVEALTGKTMDSPIQFWERESKFHQGVWLGTSKQAKERQEEINTANLKSSISS